jgi:aconitate hydratase
MSRSTRASELDRLETAGGTVRYWSLPRAAPPERLLRLPYVVRVLLENALRHAGRGALEDHMEALRDWPPTGQVEIPFFPARVLLQDFTGVPVVADLAAMRSAVARLGGDPAHVNPTVRTDLVIDHSVQVDEYGSREAFARNVALEYARNRERYAFLRWAQEAFHGFRVVPPGSGIVHQVNLERLAEVVTTGREGGETVAYPDTLVGTDSHTTMIGGIGVLGWGVGGIEAEAAMLGEPVAIPAPAVVGVRLTGRLREGATATDLVLSLTERLRAHGVVGRFVEFVGPGLDALSVPDRATVANMAPEYGATEGFFPVDEQVLSYLRGTGRDPGSVDLVERYCRAQSLFREPGEAEPEYTETLAFDLGEVEPSVAGPRRPQDRLGLSQVKRAVRESLETGRGQDEPPPGTEGLADGSVVIAAITSCTNTSNPAAMVGAGLVARAAVARGVRVPPHVKTSLAPGSPVVVDYLRRAGLIEPLEALGFHVVAFGCTTCIGNSGPLPEPVSRTIRERDLVCAAVLSGNRNFEGRIHPQVRMSFLMSPALVVAYALAGTVDVDLTTEPLGRDGEGAPVYLQDLWPLSEEMARIASRATDPSAYRRRYAAIFEGDGSWRALSVPAGDRYRWDPASTYIAEPPFLRDLQPEPPPAGDIRGARVLVVLGDTVTTDHISPAGAIPPDSPAGRWLADRGVSAGALHSYGARRGHHEVMVRGTFANIRLRNQLVPGTEGGVTIHLPSGERMSVFDAAERYRAEGVPLVVLAGREYGAGSSRDWAAKGTALLGVRAVMAESYERIHRSNLAQMGVLPLEFAPGDSVASLGLTGRETFDVTGITGHLEPGARLPVAAHGDDGRIVVFTAACRLDTPTEVRFYREGGILPAVARRLAERSGPRPTEEE